MGLKLQLISKKKSFKRLARYNSFNLTAFEDWFDSLSSQSCIALIVIYNASGNFHSLETCVSILKDIGFECVFLCNRKLTIDETAFAAKQGIFVFDRENCAGDIGAYKDGLSILRGLKKFADISYICCTNDSLQYTNLNHAKAFVDEITLQMTQKRQLIVSNDSYQSGYHYQSYFQIYSQSVFNSDQFIEFWDSFELLDSRKHLVQNGEIALTQKCLINVDDVHIICTQNRVMMETMHHHGLILNQYQWMSLIPSLAFSKELSPNCEDLNQVERYKQSSNQNNIDAYLSYLRLISMNNPSHTLGFLSAYLGILPWIKLDLVKAGTHSISEALFLYSNLIAETSCSSTDIAILDYNRRLQDIYGSKLIRKRGLLSFLLDERGFTY